MNLRWLALVFVGCGRDCTCISGEKTYESIDDPIKVELVRDTEWTGGRIPGPISRFLVRIHTNPPFDEPVDCTHVDMAENDVGNLVAFRCSKKDEKGVGPWTLVRIMKSGRHFRECAPLLDGDEPDFSGVRSLSYGAPNILACHQSPSPDTWADFYRGLVAELREGEGNPAVVRFLIDASSFDGDLSNPVWLEQLDALAEPDRAVVLRAICPSVRDADSAVPRYVRATKRCDLSDPAVGNTALERVRRGFAKGDDAAFYAAGPIAIRTHESETGDAACTFVSGPYTGDDRVPFAHEAIAIAKRKCPGLSTEAMCEMTFDCDGGLCTETEVLAEIRGWRDGGPMPIAPHVKLAAVYAQGPLPLSVTLPNARRHYAIDNDSGPPCLDQNEAGAPCTCNWNPYEHDICDVPLDGGRILAQQCSFLVDDKKKTIGDVRHACVGQSVRCSTDYDCCIGLSCKIVDGGQTCAP